MLEIFLLRMLCNKNKCIAQEKGRKPGLFVALTVILWVGLEILGIVIGFGLRLDFAAYILAIAFAAFGALLSWVIAIACPPIPAYQSFAYKTEDNHNAYQAANTYTYENKTYQPQYQPQSLTSYQSNNESNTGFMPLSGNMPDNFSLNGNNQDDNRKNLSNIINSENVNGELSFEDFEKMLNQPSKSEVS